MTGVRRYKRDGQGRFAKTASSSLAGRRSAPSARASSAQRKPGSIPVATIRRANPRKVLPGPPASGNVRVGLRSVEVTAEKRLPVARGRVQLTAQAGLKAELIAR